jgi:hypothetical protein
VSRACSPWRVLSGVFQRRLKQSQPSQDTSDTWTNAKAAAIPNRSLRLCWESQNWEAK